MAAAIFLLRIEEKAAMLVPQTPSRIEFFMLRTSFSLFFTQRANDLEIKQSVVFFLFFQPILFLCSIVLLLFSKLQSIVPFYFFFFFLSCILLYGSIILQSLLTSPFFVRLQRKFLIWRDGGHFGVDKQNKSGQVWVPGPSRSETLMCE